MKWLTGKKAADKGVGGECTRGIQGVGVDLWTPVERFRFTPTRRLHGLLTRNVNMPVNANIVLYLLVYQSSNNPRQNKLWETITIRTDTNLYLHRYVSHFWLTHPTPITIWNVADSCKLLASNWSRQHTQWHTQWHVRRHTAKHTSLPEHWNP
jgi:hypothetical protein